MSSRLFMEMSDYTAVSKTGIVFNRIVYIIKDFVV